MEVAGSHLESLPREIKARIYKYLFVNREIHIHDPNPVSSFLCLPRPTSSRTLAIQCASKTVKQDAESHVYTVSVLTPCPCFLARTDTEDFEAKVSKIAKNALQPLLKLWELRRTTQIYEHKFVFFSGTQQFMFSRDPPTGPLPLENLIPHVRKQGLSMWLKLPGTADIRVTRIPTVWVKVDSTDTITIFAQAERYGQGAKECLLDLKRSPDPQNPTIDKQNTKFDIAELNALDDDWIPEYGREWLHDYHYEYCMEGRSAAVKRFGRLA